MGKYDDLLTEDSPTTGKYADLLEEEPTKGKYSDLLEEDHSASPTPETDKAITWAETASNAYEAGKELISGMIPKTPYQYAAQVFPPLAAFEQGKALGSGDVSSIPLVGRGPEIIEAEKTPAYSKERFLTAGKTLMDVAALAGAKAGFPEARVASEARAGVAPETATQAGERGFTATPTEPAFNFQEPVQGQEIRPRGPQTIEAEIGGGETYASKIASPESVTQSEVRPRVGEEAPLRQQGETATEGQEVAPEAQVAPETPQVVIPPEDIPYTAEASAQKPSKIGQSIEAKAVEAKLTQGFGETAGYDPITIADQAQRATSFIKESPTDARAVIRGEASLPQGLRGTSLITAMEEDLLRKPDAQAAYELANSPLVKATSSAAQEMRLMSERVPDSLAAKFAEIQEARRAGSKLRGETPERVFQDIKQEIVRQSSKRPTWEAFVREITC